MYFASQCCIEWVCVTAQNSPEGVTGTCVVNTRFILSMFIDCPLEKLVL